MRICFASNNHLNRNPTGSIAKPSTDFMVADAFFMQATNQPDFIVRVVCTPVSSVSARSSRKIVKNIVRMAGLLLSGHPFQIFRSVVHLVPILMVDRMQWCGRFAMKCQTYKGVYLTGYPSIIENDRNLHVPIFAWKVRSRFHGLFSAFRPDSAQIGCLIKRVSGDWFPLFSHIDQPKDHYNIIHGAR
jgi:hypothetical protein